MSLVVMGASYKSAPISTREKAAVPTGEAGDALAALASREGVTEAALLSTCNRVECLLEAGTDRLGVDACTAFFRGRLGDAFAPSELFVLRGPEAVEHVFRVVCSLDSQVLGEAQILGQMKRAFEQAEAAETCGEVLTRLFKMALHLGKQARSKTGIGSDSVSLSTTAIKAAQQQAGSLREAKVVILGAGEMARLVAVYLCDAGCTDVTVATRTFAHAWDLAEEFGFRAVPFERRYEAIGQADLLFTATGAQSTVVEVEPLRDALAARTGATSEGRPLTIIDEAVPRDVERACGEIGGVTLFDQEALAGIVDDGLAERMAAVGEVERMIAEAEEEFLGWMQERMVQPTVREIYAKGNITLANELGHAEKELAKLKGAPLSEGEELVLEAYGRAVMKKLLHGPVVRLKKEARDADSYYYTGAARYLFGLDTFPPGTRRHCKGRYCEEGKPCPYGMERVSSVACRVAGAGEGEGR